MVSIGKKTNINSIQIKQYLHKQQSQQLYPLKISLTESLHDINLHNSNHSNIPTTDTKMQTDIYNIEINFYSVQFINRITEVVFETFYTMTYNIENIQINFCSVQFINRITEVVFETFYTITYNIENIQIN